MNVKFCIVIKIKKEHESARHICSAEVIKDKLTFFVCIFYSPDSAVLQRRKR